ncbi:ABC transporter ATP-binding protein [Pedobacter steynii]|uniref:Antibiotic ABC transporter ATP-binding protein n=1 Tax=Pedobacter steynii TaxID=430522 RepID=A0A1D7QG03_9SPHI|nr:ABC transporter ATP-binding protein [Pedobacter steynii]AOM77591.1 antibiotic ABC transporter ATP-binding protein [Pedobacter steynii]
MKTYFRLLSFAKPIEKFALPYALATILAIICNTFLFTLLGPLLETLFSSKGAASQTIMEKASALDFIGNLNRYIGNLITTYGKVYTLKFVCGLIVVAVFLANLFRYLSQRYMEDLRVHTLLNLRRTVFNNIMDLHAGYFSNERKGDIMSKVASDVQIVQFSVTNTLQVVFKEPIQLLFYIAVLLSISVKLTLFSLLVIPISGFIISKIVKRLKQQAMQAHESFAKMIGFLDESLGAIKIIKAFNASDRIKEKFNEENIYYSNLTRKMVRRQQLASPVSQTLGVLVVVCIVLYGGTMILNNQSELTPAKFLVYIATFSQVMQPIKAIADSFTGIHSGITAGMRVLELIDTKAEMTEKSDAVAIPEFKDSIRFENVHFSYGEKPVLQGINLTIKKGQTVALVGSSGGGKSTLVDLIPRFYDPQKGSIYMDGHDLKDITLNSLRAQLGTVNQQSILFNDTIANNIAFSRPDASREEIIEAARIANADDFILHTENGYDTNIGDGGNKLSGGQKQRLCIARAVLANPPVMLLDEATSALDTESERLVQDALFRLMENRTSVVIAHRLSTIQNADLIVVIDKGKIVETGTHQELIRLRGVYNKLIDMQTFSEE